MIQQAAKALPDLYEADETAWLEAMAELIRAGKYKDLDYAHLSEYLSDMAMRDRREVQSRLRILLAHVLQWESRKKKRTGSRKATILRQRDELELLLESAALRSHAEVVLPRIYATAVELAAVETGVPAETFPRECPYTVERLLAEDLPGE